ncbi:hypothetical protein C8J56DRAFT_1026601 [Mycena floridula]|nr:hypothetical protein C8J56DRAFT_1026601 [Mycena floridula]
MAIVHSATDQALTLGLFDDLKVSIRGQLYLQGSPNFREFSTVFNGNVTTFAQAVTCPLDAEDVSKILIFCAKHSLSPSVKSGGYGTAGWAIAGDVIIDTIHLSEIEIEVPRADGGFVSLRDMPPANSKGNKVLSPPTRRDEDLKGLRNYDNASSPAVAGFLQGPAFVYGGPVTEEECLRVRRHLNDSVSTSESSSPSEVIPPLPLVLSRSASIAGTSVSGTLHLMYENGPRATSVSRPRVGADPFGYINAPPTTASWSTQANFAHTSAVSTSRSFVANPNLPAANIAMPSQLQPVHEVAYVTFGSGKRQKEVDIYTACHPLPARSHTGSVETVPYHIPFSAHPVGSAVMLQGGFGFLSRLRGLSIDVLVEVEMVLADGRIVIVNEKNYPDLWFAIKGAGPTLGVCTRYKAKAYPVPIVFAGNLIYRFRKSTAASLIKHFRDCVKGAPRELYANVILTAGPAGKDSLVVIQMCYIGPKEKGQEFLSAISSWNGEACLLNEVDEKSFLHQQDSVAQVLHGKAGRQWFIRSTLITSLPDDIIHNTVLQFSDTPVGCTWLFEIAGGAVTEFEDSCVPKSQREASFNVVALHQWEMGIDDPRCVSTAEEWIAGTLKPVSIGGPLPCFLGRHEAPDRVMSCYGNNWDRLCEIKQIYDPNNMFRNSLWPLDDTGAAVDPRSHEPSTP